MNGLLHAHSGLRWVVLILLMASIAKGFTAASSGQPYGKGLFAATMGFLHVQVILGLILYIKNILPNLQGIPFGNIMKNGEMRFWAVEHLSMMLLAAILATVGYSMGKRAQTDAKKNRTTAIFYTISLLLILAAIPWASRPMF